MNWNEIGTLLHCAVKLQGHPNLKALLDVANWELVERTKEAVEFMEAKRVEKAEAEAAAEQERLAAAEQAKEEEAEANESAADDASNGRRV